jgi:sugar/nucleoside kinase (ribokinase family)
MDYLDSKFIFLANIDPALQIEVLDRVPGAQFTVADTMNLWIDIAADNLEKVLARVDAVMLNDSEARQLAGTDNLMKAARDVMARGPEAVIIKKGEHGVLMFTPGGTFALPAYPLENVKDPTGAGDSFAGGFIGSLCAAGAVDDASLRRALLAGTATASLCCEDFSVYSFQRADKSTVAGRIRAVRDAMAVDAAPLIAAIKK